MVYFLYIYILLLINYIICLTAAMDGVYTLNASYMISFIIAALQIMTAWPPI